MNCERFIIMTLLRMPLSLVKVATILLSYVFFRHDADITNRIFAESGNGDKYMPQEMLRTHWYKRMNDEKAPKVFPSDPISQEEFAQKYEPCFKAPNLEDTDIFFITFSR